MFAPVLTKDYLMDQRSELEKEDNRQSLENESVESPNLNTESSNTHENTNSDGRTTEENCPEM